jgi:hypothetical protein
MTRKAIQILAVAFISVSIMVIAVSISSISDNLQGSVSAQAPNAAEWLSAVATFWGAVATAFGAILTAGALLVAAFTYLHQVDEKNRAAQDRRDKDSKERRAQAASVSVLTAPSETKTDSIVMTAYNGSPLPIRNVLLTCVDRRGQVMGQEMKQVVPAGGSAELERPERVIDKVVARFTDAEGRVWRSYVNGEFEEA